jgi:hypothetical protein
MAARPASTGRATFEPICSNCETVAVTFECAEGALDNTPVFCGNCGRLRGLIGAIRKLAHESSAPVVSQGLTDEAIGQALV